MITSVQQKIILDTLNPYHPKTVAVFGSYARNENKEGSDLDLLVDLQARINLLDWIGIEQELSDVLGIRVELIQETTLDPLVKPYVEKDLTFIFRENEK